MEGRHRRKCYLGMLTSLAPILSRGTRLLVLGSFPGAASLRAQEYYAHPQNHFWPILGAIWPGLPSRDLADSYVKRCQWLLDQGLGLWDVYAACDREGSLDTAIRNAVLNDFSILKDICPNLSGVAHNGGESFKHSRHMAALGLPIYKLPSSSAANASWSFERKVRAWRLVLQNHAIA